MQVTGADRLRAVADWLASGSAVRLGVLLGVLLVLPSVTAGLMSDDYWQLAMTEARRPPWDLFHFVPAGSGGGGIWISDASQTIAFFRPLPSLLHYVEYRWFPHAPGWMHAHSILWYGLVIAAVGVMFRELGGRRWPAGLAVLLFALDASHGPVVGWLASRAVLMGVAAGAVTLILHHRSRSPGGRRWIAVASFGLVLLTGEPGVTMMAYLLAYAACMDRGPAVDRLRSVLPYVLLAGAWWGATRAMGYGVRGTGLYVGEGWSGVESVITVLRDAALLILMQLGWPGVDALVAADLQAWLPALGFLGVVGTIVVAVARCHRAVGFWALGAVLAAIPLGLGLPHPRVLMPVSVGVAALPPLLLYAALGALPPGRRWAVVWAAALGLGAQLSLAGILIGLVSLPHASLSLAASHAPHHRIARTVDARPDQAAVVLNAPDLHLGPMTPIVRRYLGLRSPGRVVVLSAGEQPVTVERAGPRRLRLSGSPDLFGPQSRPLRAQPFREGERLDLGIGRVEVLEVNARGEAEAIEVTLRYPLDSPRLAFFTAVGSEAEPVELPEAGSRLVLGAYAEPREEEGRSGTASETPVHFIRSRQ